MSVVEPMPLGWIARWISLQCAEIEYRSWFPADYWLTDADIEYLSWGAK